MFTPNTQKKGNEELTSGRENIMIKDYNPSNIVSPKIVAGPGVVDEEEENKDGPQSGLDTIIANEE